MSLEKLDFSDIQISSNNLCLKTIKGSSFKSSNSNIPLEIFIVPGNNSASKAYC
ncbi:MAG: hypothetical protein ACFFBH_13805 [Promethearchaeota archaeon]